MKKIKIVILVGVLCSLNACSNDIEKQKPDVFQDSAYLKSTVLIGADRLIDPWVLTCLDSVLVVGNKKGEPLVELYDFNGNILDKIIKKGKGKDEVLCIGSIQRDFGNRCFYVYDLFNKKTLRISKINRIDTSKVELIDDYKTMGLPQEDYDKIYIFKQNFIGESRSPKGRIMQFMDNGKEVKYAFSFPPPTDTSITAFENAKLYSAEFAFSPDFSKLVVSTYSAGLIDLYKIDDYKIDSIWSYEDFLPSNLKRVSIYNSKSYISFSGKSQSGYSSVDATDKFVYAIYSGKYFREDNYTFSNIIRIISWDGKKRYKILLDREINRLTVKKDNSVLYGLSMNKNGEPEIVSFKLPVFN